MNSASLCKESFIRISDFEQYKYLASRTMNSNLSEKESLSMASMGLSGESGELGVCLIESVINYHPFDAAREIDLKIKKEIGDVFWYVSAISNLLKINLDEAIGNLVGVSRSGTGRFIEIVSNKCYELRIHHNTYAVLASSPNSVKRAFSSQFNLLKNSSLIIDDVKKNLFHGHNLDVSKVKQNLAHLIMELCFVSYCQEYYVEDVLVCNIKKLMKRYPEGFSEERSINRED